MTHPLDSTATLPSEIALFPLPGVLLLPGGHLPLQVFEPRYLNMIEDVLGLGRMIALVQPREQADPVPDTAPLYDVGCAGRIVGFKESDDGRFYITIHGLSRFHIVEDLLTLDGYRMAKTDYSQFIGDGLAEESPLDRTRLLNVIKAYLGEQDLEYHSEVLEEASDINLVTSLAMSCPFHANEKQALLECQNLESRGNMLVSLMEMTLNQPASTLNLQH